jgi:hypothetical protein
MNKKVIIGIILAVVVIGGGVAAYYVTNNQTDNDQKTSSKQSSDEASETSLAALQAKGQPRKCTYSNDVKNGKYTGTAYFSSDKQMRNDYKSTVNGTERNGGMIITGDTQYFWNNETKKGYKMAIKADDSKKTSSSSSSSSSTQTSNSDSVDTKAKYSFNCEAWTVDDSKFTPPSDIAIQDLTQMMQNMPTSGQ